jgi:hypothetical protein
LNGKILINKNIYIVTMSAIKPKRTPAVYALVTWMVINAVFMALEVTVFNDAADLNNSILLVLWAASTVGMLLMKKYGAAFATFTLIYAFSFNAFNAIYFGLYLLNVPSAIINAVAAVYMFISIFKNKFT